MKPILFSIFGLNVYSYGLMYALSLIVGLFYAEYRAKKNGLDKDFVFSMGLYSIIIGVIGAKVLHLITVIPDLINDFWPTFKSSLSSGFVVYGGIISAALFALFYTKKKKHKFLIYFDIAAPAIALGEAIGRIGCFLSGCCYGIQTDAWFGITFPAGSFAPAGVSLVPIQPISAFLNLANCIILIIAYKRFKKVGMTAGLFMINYGVGRFVVEFFRNDYRGAIGPLSTSQFISIFVVILGIALMVKAKDKSEYESEFLSLDKESEQCTDKE